MRNGNRIALVSSLLGSLVTSLAGCTADDPGLSTHTGKADDIGSFEEFKEQLYCEPDRGDRPDMCFVQGDIPVLGDADLKTIYNRLASGGQSLTVMHENGTDSVWDKRQRMDLTYCVSREFGDRRDEVLVVMSRAAQEWEDIAHVRFRHVFAEDDNCDADNDKVLFDVSPSPDFAFYYARAFFPSYDDRFDRRVLINFPSIDQALEAGDSEGLNLQGIMRHELGHVLGFRHEHIRPENAASFFCSENDDFRTITEYDARSTMHYPQCDGEGDWSLRFSEIDREGSRFFYPDFDRYRGGRCDIEVIEGELNRDCQPVVHEILQFANIATFEELDEWAGLDVRSAEAIFEGRATAPFQSIEELLDVPFLGEGTLLGMYEYLYVDGRCPQELDGEGRPDVRCRPVVHRILELANQGSFTELDDDVGLDIRAVENLTAARADGSIDALADLWAISFVKTRALGKMYKYLYPSES